MKKYQESIYKITLVFSVIINLLLLVLVFFVIKDSLAESGEWQLQGRSFWFFLGVVLAYSLANIIFIVRYFGQKSIKN